jgi:hypothetical protein
MAKRSIDRGAAKGVAEDRIKAIEPIVELLGVSKNRRFPHLLPDGARIWTISAAVRYCAEHSQRSPRTIRRWLARFKAAGESAFARRSRSDKARSRFFTHYPKAAAFAAYVHQLTRETARAVHQAIARHRRLLGVPAARVPCAETVRVWLRSAAPELRELISEGQRKYREIVFADIDGQLLTVRKGSS